jgi:hypothetical protein
MNALPAKVEATTVPDRDITAEIRRWTKIIAWELAKTQIDNAAQRRVHAFAFSQRAFIKSAFVAERARAAVVEELATKFTTIWDGTALPATFDDFRLIVAMHVAEAN